MSVGAAIGMIAVGILVHAWVHHGYAWRGYQAAKAAVPAARRTWLARLGDLIRVIAILTIAVGIWWLATTGPQR